MDGYEIRVTCNCGAKRTPFVGAVPSFEQFSAQQSRAVAVCASLLGMSAALQQSMSPIAWSMPQDCSSNCTGTPPNTLPLNSNIRTRDVSRIRMTVRTLWIGSLPVKSTWATAGVPRTYATPSIIVRKSYTSFIRSQQEHFWWLLIMSVTGMEKFRLGEGNSAIIIGHP